MDTLHLQRRHQTWYVVVEVPRDLRPFLGRRLVRSLKTRDLKEARRLRHPVLAEFQAKIDAERRKWGGESAPPGTVQRAMLWRQDIVQARATGREELEDALAWKAEEEARELEAKAGPETAHTFFSIALGHGTPLSTLTDTWLRESPLTAKTKAQRQAAVNELVEWAGGEVLVEMFGRKEAGAFISKHLLPTGKAPATINGTISALSAYWRWLMKRGHAKENPWEKQSLPLKPIRGVGEELQERAFTDEELTRLLAGNPSELLRTPIAAALGDIMRVAALSGMRVEEIAQLRAQDVAEGVFVVRQGKTKAAVRNVPIHPALAELVRRRSAGKPPSAFLFHELEEGAFGKRSAALVKAFVRYAKKLGVREEVEGKRRSLVNFHSFRRWFVTKAHQAGQPVHLVEAVVGHKPVGMTLGRYSAGPSREQLRVVVESVKLPGA